ncbi:MAG: FAD-binding protein, partial [Bilophila wadsworthia]
TIKRVMARIVRESGVDVLDRVMAVKILTDGGKACGALGWNVSTGEFHIIRAKTVVSAQGRSATRGTDNSTHNPYNVWMYPYNTSAGVVLGYDAGAAVTELDTYQRATMLPKGYGCPGMNGINSSGAHEINALGERFMGKYDPTKWCATTRFRAPSRNSSKGPARLSIWICGMWTKPWFASCRIS